MANERILMRRHFLVVAILLACTAPRDATTAPPSSPPNALRTDLLGCYAMTQRPPRGDSTTEVWATLNVLELDSARIEPAGKLRWMHLDTAAFRIAYPGPAPATIHRLAASWVADSLSDSLTISVGIDVVALSVRLVRGDGGSLTGTARIAGERGSRELGPVAWRRTPCQSLTLDRRRTV